MTNILSQINSWYGFAHNRLPNCPGKEHSSSAFSVHATYSQDDFLCRHGLRNWRSGSLPMKNKRLIFINKIFHFNKGKVPAGCLHLIKIQRQEVWGFKLPRLNFLLTDSCTNWKSPVTDQLCCWPRNYVCMYFIFVKFTLNVLMKSVIWKPRFTQCLQLEGTSGCHLVQAGSGSTSDLT